MSNNFSENFLREQICVIGKSLFDRGLTHGSTGNISAVTENGDLLITPTGCSLGRLQPDQVCKITSQNEVVGTMKPTKELFLHKAFYENNFNKVGAVVHLHSTYSVAYSMLPNLDVDNIFQPLTPYSIMLLGKVKLLPFYLPGDPKLGDVIKGVASKRSAVLLANHGPVVSGKNLESATNAIEELENTAKLSMITRGFELNLLNEKQIKEIVNKFNVNWD